MTTAPQNATAAMVRDARLALGMETVWGHAAPRFFTVAATYDTIGTTPLWRRPQKLGGIAGKNKLMHQHVSGSLALPVNRAVASHLFSAILAHQPMPQSDPLAPSATPQNAISAAHEIDRMVPGTTALSFTLLKYYRQDAPVAVFSGLRLRTLTLRLEADGIMTAMGQFVGRQHTTIPAMTDPEIQPLAGDIFGVAHSESYVELSVGDGAATQRMRSGVDIHIETFQLTLSRLGMKPVFSLAADHPQRISSGVLTLGGRLHLFCNDFTSLGWAQVGQELGLKIIAKNPAGNYLHVYVTTVKITASHVDLNMFSGPIGLQLEFSFGRTAKRLPEMSVFLREPRAGANGTDTT
jgi:hypothetical protein